MGGGSGRRYGQPKQYAQLDDERVIDRSRRIAAAVSDGVVLVVPAADVERESGVAGGDTRSASVRAGLSAVPDDALIICIHDAARPLASVRLYRSVIEAVQAGADAAIPGISVDDTIKVVDPSGRVIETPDRSTLFAVQTPQAFRASALRAAHAGGDEATDDASLVEADGGIVVVVAGEANNRKITHPDDLDWARSVVIAADTDRRIDDAIDDAIDSEWLGGRQ